LIGYKFDYINEEPEKPDEEDEIVQRNEIIAYSTAFLAAIFVFS